MVPKLLRLIGTLLAVFVAFACASPSTAQSYQLSGDVLQMEAAEVIAQMPMALSLDGVDDHVFVDDAPEFGDAFTIEAWVRVEGGDHVAIVGKSGSFDLLILSDGRLEYNVPGDHLTTPSGTITRGTWHHVAVIYNAGDSPALRMLVDGTAVTSGDVGVGGGSLAAGASTASFVVGQRPVLSPLYFDGEIDDLRVWDRARSNEQIAAHKNEPLAGDEDGLALYYRFEVLRNLRVGNDGADDVQDHSGNERHADGVSGASITASTAPIEAARVSASDDAFEQQVEIEWNGGEAGAQFVQVLRDGKLLASVSSQTTRFSDTTGDPFVVYTYCVVEQQSDGSRATLGCDVGRRRLKAAEAVVASDGLFDDRVRLTWRDRSGYETGYQIWRDGTKIATTAAGFVTYDDETATLEGSPYTYCVTPEIDGVAGTTARCDDGSVGAVLPVTDVAASDGTYPNAVLITWADQGDGATAFRLFRNGDFLHDVNLSGSAVAADTRYEDRTATPGEVYNYCVRRFEGGTAGVDRCDDGSIGTLAAPGDVTATDGTFDDQVRVTWADRSDDEAGYRVTRRGGSALAFDGTDDYLSVPDSDALDFTDAFTIEAWVRPRSGGYIVSKDGVGIDPTGAYGFSIDGNGALAYETNNQGGVKSAAGMISFGTWTHVAVTFEDGNGDGTGRARLYANGTEIHSGDVAAPRALSTDLVVGRRGVGSFFQGEIDELRIWGERRSQADLRATLFAGLTGDERGLAAYYPLDEGSGTLARDGYGIAALAFPSAEGDRPAWTTETAPFVQHGVGLALELDGTDDYAEVAASDAPALGIAFTLEAWVYPTVDQHATILSTDDGVDGAALFRVLSGGRLNAGTRGGAELTAPGGSIPLNQWSHVAVVRDEAASDNTRLYVGGVLVALGKTAVPSGQRAMQIGRMYAGQHFAGRIDDLRIWASARSAAEIAAARYTLPAGATPVAHYRFDALATDTDGALDIAVDAAGDADAHLMGGWLAQGPSALLTEADANVRSYTDRDAAPGVAQTYCVSTFTTQGAETAPVCDAGHRARAQQPTSLAASDDAFEDRIRITWTSASSRAAFFKLYRDGALIQTLPVATQQFEDIAIASGRAYTYCLATVSNEGAESPQVCDDGSRLLAAPARVDASDDGEERSVTISWVDESEVERGYLVFRRALSEAGTLAADSSRVDSLGASVTTVKDRAGVAGVRYQYSVTAVDAHGQSASPADRGRRTIIQPTGLAAEDGVNETRVRLTWTDGSALETGYRVYRDGDIIADDLPANTNTFVDTTPSQGATALYAVEAFQGDGGALGVSARAEDTGSTTLLAPGTVAASDDDSAVVRLAWADQSAIESGYVLLRDGVPFQYDLADRSAAVDANSSPVAGVAYTYCVRAWIDGDEDGDPWADRFGALDAGDMFSEPVCDTGMRSLPPAAESDFVLLDDVIQGDDTESGDEFGYAVAIYGDWMLVGARGVSGSRGAVYAFERSESGWQQRQKILASDGGSGDRFGISVVLTESFALIGASDKNDRTGAVYLYERTPAGWVEQQVIEGSENGVATHGRFGEYVQTDGNWFIVGAAEDDGSDGDDIGSIYVFQREESRLIRRAGIPNPVATNSKLWGKVAISNAIAVVGAPEPNTRHGFVSFLRRTNSGWSRVQDGGAEYFVEPQGSHGDAPQFGAAVAIYGNQIIVGSPYDQDRGDDDLGAVYFYEFGNDRVGHPQKVFPSAGGTNEFGRALGISNDQALVTALGDAYVYSREGTTWSETMRLRGTGGSGQFGWSAALSPQGTVVIGDRAGNQVFLLETKPAAPEDFVASDGTFENRVEISWKDRADNEDSYHVYRDGKIDAIAVLPAGTTTYIDLDALPGEVHEYCVQSVRDVYDDRSELVCDIGRRAPDGVIQGQIRASLGGTVPGVQVCLAPAPNGAVLLNGVERSLNTAEATPMSDNVTIEMWAKLSPGQDAGTLFYHAGSTLELGYRGSGDLFFTFVSGSDRLLLEASPGDVWDPAEWTHYAARFDDSDNVATLFVNGHRVAEATASADYATTAGRYWIGQYEGGTHAIAGQIDELRVWNQSVPAGIIEARVHRTPTPTEQLGMVAYWPLDERHSNTFANVASGDGALYLRGTSSAAPSRPGAPLETCAISDNEGSFGFRGLRYGESTAFTLLPSDPDGAPKTFLPATRTVTLSRENPVQNEIELVDMTSYTLSGTAFHEGPSPSGGTMLTECALEGTQIIVGDQQGESVDNAGRFRATAPQGSEAVSVRLVPDRDDFVLEPATISFLPVADSSGVSVRQSTQRRLDLSFVGGSCAFDMGTATVKIRAEGGCFETEVTVGKNGQALYLPPLDYTVQVTDVQNDDPTLRVAMLDYFAAAGGQAVSLVDSSQTVPVRYTGPVSVAISGLPGPSCTAGDVAGVPVLSPGHAIDLTVSVSEDYGAAGSCPASEATVLLFNEVGDRATVADTLVLSPSDDGRIGVPLDIGSPNLVQGRIVDGVDRSYQKFITAVAEVEGRSATETTWAVVEGTSSRPGEQFVTMPSSPTPLWVLRDPPGDASYSYLEAGASSCLNMSKSTGLNYALGPELEFNLGTTIDTGVSFMGEGSIEFQLGAGLTLGYRYGSSSTKSDAVELCFETNEVIQTSDDSDFIGADADLFIGAGLSMVFSKADALHVDEGDDGTCAVELSESLAFRPEVNNMFVHSRSHIENTIIPRLDSVIVQAPEAAVRDSARAGIALWERMLIEADLTKYVVTEPFARQAGTARLTLDVRGAQNAAGGDPESASAQAGVIEDRVAALVPSGLPAISGIGNQLTNAISSGGGSSIDLGLVSDMSQSELASLRRQAKAKRLDINLSALPDESRRTISYDAGAIYEYSYTHTYDHMYSQEIEKGHSFSGSIFAYASTNLLIGALGPASGAATLVSAAVFPPLGLVMGGVVPVVGVLALASTENSQIGFEFEVEMVTAYGLEASWGEGTTVGYVLSDDDSDDSFLVHVLMDPIYGTPIFDTVAGYGSCPYEPWDSFPLTAEGVDFESEMAPRVVPRDAPKLRVDAPKLSGLAPDEAAVFTLFMENGSPSEEARAYRLQLLNPSNPYGAVLRAGGNTLGGLDYVIEPGQTQELALTVERGPRRYAYDNLALSLAPQCEAEAASIDQASIADTAYVSVDFAAPCSDVDLRLPGADWTLADADANNIDVLMSGLNLEPNDKGSGVAQVGLEYRRAGTDDPWAFAFAAPIDTILVQNGLPDGTRTPSDLRAATAYGESWTLPSSLPDGAYEMRAVTECRIGSTVSGRNYSAPAPGLVDRVAPEVLGTPSPEDRFLEVGDDIALTFAEPLDCGSLRTTGDTPNVTLRRTDTGVPIPIRTVCDGKRMVIEPQDPSAWAALEGIEVEARVADATDGAGNVMAEAEVWSFVVRRSAFGFALADVGVEVGLGQSGTFEVPLANGRTSAVAFEVTSLPDWLFASPMQGSLKPGTSLDMSFQIAPFDTVGVVRDTVDVTSAAGLIRLPIETEIRCAPSTWRVDPADYRTSMSVTAQVFVDGIASDDPLDQLAAFVGSEIRGLTTVAPQPGGNRASVLVYSNASGGEPERVRFEVWDASECRQYGTTSKTLLYAEDAAVGTPSQPVAIRVGETPGAGQIALNAGWTWISTNRSQDDMRVSTVFAEVDAGPDDLIKSQTAFAVYAPNSGWVGSLSALAPGVGYQVYLNQSQGVSHPGMPVDPAATPIELRSGWNWIGYTPQAGQPLEEGLAGITPVAGDLIKSQTAFAVYDASAGWVGSFDAFAPGEGYQMRMTTGQTLTFAEPAPSVAITMREPIEQQAVRGPNPSLRETEVETRSADGVAPAKIVAAHTREATALRMPEGWSVQAAAYPHTQSVVARAIVEGDALVSEGALLAAFAPDGLGGEVCRGVATVQQVGDQALFFLTTYGTTPAGEVLTLRLYDPATNAEHTALPTLDFVADALVGTVGDPFVVRDAASTSVETEIPEAFELEGAYPNPFRGATRLSYALPTAEHVRLVLFDVLGREVQVLVDAEQPPGHHHVDLPARGLASGVYLYRIEAGAHEATKQVVLVK